MIYHLAGKCNVIYNNYPCLQHTNTTTTLYNTTLYKSNLRTPIQNLNPYLTISCCVCLCNTKCSMDQENLVLEGGAESSNTVQDVTRQSNVNENVSELNVTTESTSPSSTNFSVSSESNLFVPSKLNSDILNLKNCYIDIIKLIDPYKNSSSSSLENPNIVLMLNKEQMLAGIKKNKLGAEGTKVNLVNLMDCVRPLCLPSYQCDTRPKLSSSSQDCDISALTSRVDSLCTQNRVDFESIKTQMESLKTTFQLLKMRL